MTDITIPPEALEAVARKLAIDTEGTDEWWTLYMRRAHAACLAMLKAWPGMRVSHRLDEWGPTDPQIILPLTQEANDAET